jgi:hypothetical protein
MLNANQLRNQVARAMMTALKVTLALTGSVSIHVRCLIPVHPMQSARLQITGLCVIVQVVLLETLLLIATKFHFNLSAQQILNVLEISLASVSVARTHVW